MTVEFISDNEGTYGGFSAYYTSSNVATGTLTKNKHACRTDNVIRIGGKSVLTIQDGRHLKLILFKTNITLYIENVAGGGF
jgi:hypothetical protein